MPSPPRQSQLDALTNERDRALAQVLDMTSERKIATASMVKEREDMVSERKIATANMAKERDDMAKERDAMAKERERSDAARAQSAVELAKECDFVRHLLAQASSERERR